MERLARKVNRLSGVYVKAQLSDPGPMVRIQPYEGLVECAMEWIKKVTGNPQFFAGVTDINVSPEPAYGHVSYEMNEGQEAGRGTINVNVPRIKAEMKDPFQIILNIALTLAHEQAHLGDFRFSDGGAEYPGGETVAQQAETQLSQALNSEYGMQMLESLPCWKQFG